MSLGQAGTQLTSDLEGFLLVKRTICCQVCGQCLPFEEFHRQEVDFTLVGLRRMNLIYQTDVRVAHLKSPLPVRATASAESQAWRI